MLQKRLLAMFWGALKRNQIGRLVASLSEGSGHQPAECEVVNRNSRDNRSRRRTLTPKSARKGVVGLERRVLIVLSPASGWR
jgi:hypothetical protein